MVAVQPKSANVIPMFAKSGWTLTPLLYPFHDPSDSCFALFFAITIHIELNDIFVSCHIEEVDQSNFLPKLNFQIMII